MYLCDQCDIAGFVEINQKTIAFELGTDKSAVEKALNELCPTGKQEIEKASREDEEAAPRILYSNDGKFIFIRNFIKHQKNLPLNENNKAHRGIINRLTEKIKLFGFETIEDFFKAPSKPLHRGYGIGNSITNSKDKDRDIGGMGEKEKEKTKTWRESFEIYLEQISLVYNNLIQNEAFIKEREKYHPNLDIRLSLEKAYKDFWGTEAGWKNKKSSRSNQVDWVRTFKNALDQRMNQVFKQRNNGQSDNQVSAGGTYSARQNAADKERSRGNLEEFADAILGQHTP